MTLFESSGVLSDAPFFKLWSTGKKNLICAISSSFC